MSEKPSEDLPETIMELAAWFEQFLMIAEAAIECGAESLGEITRRVAYYQGYMDAAQLAQEPGQELLANGRLRLRIELDALDKSAKHLRLKGPSRLDSFDVFLGLYRQYGEMVDDIDRISSNDTYSSTLKLEVARFGGYREAISLTGHDPALIIHGIARLKEAIKMLRRDVGN